MPREISSRSSSLSAVELWGRSPKLGDPKSQQVLRTMIDFPCECFVAFFMARPFKAATLKVKIDAAMVSRYFIDD